MRKNFKRYLRNAACALSLANGYWVFQVGGNDPNNWSTTAAAVLSGWVCYYSVLWIAEGLRSK